ncbi:MAG: FtsX-like permease family protein [Bacteroidia bacterium]
MNLHINIARKYFFSGKVSGIVHIISAISMLGVVVGTAALIIILSVFNGFENLVISLYNSFDPDIKILPYEGKFFESDTTRIKALKNIDGVLTVSKVLEENVLARYEENQTFARIKGVEPDFIKTVGIDTTVFVGEPFVKQGNIPYALLGMGVSGKLAVNVYNDFRYLQLYIPKGDQKIILNPKRAFNRQVIRPSGIFSIQREFDDKYILTPYAFAEKLTGKKGQLSSIEINISQNADMQAVRQMVEKIYSDFKVLDRFQQHSFLYKILRSEKMAVYLILTFVLLIAAFNLIASLSMLSIEKKKDITILSSMGMHVNDIQRIFLTQGMMLSLSGALIGLFIGGLLALLQEHYGLVGLGGTSFVTNAYPVELRWQDALLVFATVLAIGFLASYIPAKNSTKGIQINELQTR